MEHTNLWNGMHISNNINELCEFAFSEIFWQRKIHNGCSNDICISVHEMSGEYETYSKAISRFWSNKNK